MEDHTLVIVVLRHPDGEGRCRRCGWPVRIDARTARALSLGAAMLCRECSHDLARAGLEFDPAEGFGDLT